LNTTQRFRRFIAPVLNLNQALVNKHVAENGKFKLGDWLVEPALDRISQGKLRLNVRPQVMDILVYLAHHRGEVVSADELLSRVWDGRVVTTASIYTALNQLREALGDDAQDSEYIKTIPRRGYRLIADVAFLDQPKQASPDFFPADGAAKTATPKYLPSIALALAVLAITAYFGFSFLQQKPADTGYPDGIAQPQSVAVLPFTDMSPDHDFGWFADGIAEEILNKLAQVPGLKVSGRTSSFAFREPEAEIQTIGRTLGVAHLLEGSVRRDGDHVRITAQLIKAKDGFHIWSQEYDREVTEILAIQDDIAANIAKSLRLQLVVNRPIGAGEIRGYYPDFTAYELYLQALDMIHRSTSESLVGALAKLEKALEREPEFAAAHLAMAKTYGRLYQSLTYYGGDNIEESQARMRPHLEKALAIDPDLAEAYVIQTWLMDDENAQMASLRKAIALNPNLASAHQELGVSLANGWYSWREAVAHLDKALEVEPLSLEAAILLVNFLQYLPSRSDEGPAILANLKQRDPDHPAVIGAEGGWLLGEGRLAEAVPLLERAIIADPDNFNPRFMLNIAWFSLGETERALEAPYWQRQWRLVLAPDRDDSLRQLAAVEYADRPMEFSYRALSAYIYLMLREWQTVVDIMAPQADGLAGFRIQCEAMCGKRYSPALSLATAYYTLGDDRNSREFLAIEQEAMNARSENGRIHNFEYTKTLSRINALEGRPYEAMLELERLISTGPLDPRELRHPAFDKLQGEPGFARLRALERRRVNSEREKLGLEPLPEIEPPRLAHTPQ